MRREELITRLQGLLPSQFEAVLFRSGVPTEHLPGASASQVTRAIEMISYPERRGDLEHLARIVDAVAISSRLADGCLATRIVITETATSTGRIGR